MGLVADTSSSRSLRTTSARSACFNEREVLPSERSLHSVDSARLPVMLSSIPSEDRPDGVHRGDRSTEAVLMSVATPTMRATGGERRRPSHWEAKVAGRKTA